MTLAKADETLGWGDDSSRPGLRLIKKPGPDKVKERYGNCKWS